MAEQSNPTIEQAELLLQEGKFREARQILVVLLKQNPTSAAVWWTLSQTVEDQDQAIDCLERTLKFDPGHEQARVRLEQLKNPTSPAADPPLMELPSAPISAEEAWEPSPVTAPIAVEKAQEESPEAEPVAVEEGREASPETEPGAVDETSEESPVIAPIVIEEAGAESPAAEPVMIEWEAPAHTDTATPAEVPMQELIFSTGEPVTPQKEKFDLFAPGAFEKYTARQAESPATPEAAHPWVEQLLETLNASEEIESSESSVQETSEVPAWAVPAEPPVMVAPGDAEEITTRNRMSVLEIILLIILVLLIIAVGGFFALSLLGII